MSWWQAQILWLLAGLIVAVACWIWIQRWRRQRNVVFGDLNTLQTLLEPLARRTRLYKGLLWALAIAGVIVALAGPQYGSRTTLLKRRGIDIVIALDFSKSMLAQDVRPNRIDRAKSELFRLLEELRGNQIGIVAFAGETIEFPLTVDDSALRLFLRELSPYDMPVGGTAIAKALKASEQLLVRAQTKRQQANPEQMRDQVVILMTDGEDHEGNPLEVAQSLAEQGIRIYAIGIGSAIPQPIPTYTSDGTWTGYAKDDAGEAIHTALSDENEAALRELARASRGRYWRAKEGSVGVTELRNEFQQLRQSEDEARKVTVHENRFALVLMIAFLLLVLEALIPETWPEKHEEVAR